VEFAPDGVSLAAAADGGSVVTMETETGQQRASGLYGGLSDIAHWLDYEKTRNEAARRRLQVSDMAYSPDGTRLMVATWGGVLATLEVGETRLSRLLEADLDTAIRDLDIIAARAGEAPQVLVALKDAPTLYRRIDGSEPDRRFGPGSRAAIEADVLSAAPLIVLRASPDGGLDLWASSRIGENRALRRAEAAQAASPALSRRYNAALRAGIAEVAERGAAIRNAFASGDCARFDSFGRQAALYQQQQDQTCPQRAEAARISALETQLLEQIRSGGCEAAERLWQQLGAPGVVRGNVFDRPAREVCRTVAEMVSLGREIEQQKAAGRCGRMEELTAALLDTLATLPPGPGARPLSDAERDRTILKAETDCEATRILEHAGAQEMFLAAVRKEAAGDTRAARKIYEALMTRHVDDPVALKAGDRMIALIDRSAAPGAAAPAAPPKAGAAPDAAPGDVIVPFGAAPKP
jgi:hypothetical protein